MDGYTFDKLQSKKYGERTEFFAVFSFEMNEKEIFAAETIDRNHPHHDWLISHRGNGIAYNIYLICKKCKCIFDISDASMW